MTFKFLHIGTKWNLPERSDLGFMNLVNSSLCNLELHKPGSLPDLKSGQTLLLGSDYGGEHRAADYQVLAFLLTCLDGCAGWEEDRQSVRRKFLADGRRLSYKALRDRRRQAALLPFLRAANRVPGMLMVLLIDKRVKSMFHKTGTLDMQADGLSDFGHWRSDAFEKLLRIVHFASLLVAGLSAPGQDLLWFTDEDAIAPNDSRVYDLVEAFKRICSHYLQHDLRHIRIGTSRSDTGKRDIEDLLSIPDLCAGALGDAMTCYRKDGDVLKHGLMLPPPGSLPPKAYQVLNWFSDKSQPLRRLVYAIDTIERSSELSLRHVVFHGTNEIFV